MECTVVDYRDWGKKKRENTDAVSYQEKSG